MTEMDEDDLADYGDEDEFLAPTPADHIMENINATPEFSSSPPQIPAPPPPRRTTLPQQTSSSSSSGWGAFGSQPKHNPQSVAALAASVKAKLPFSMQKNTKRPAPAVAEQEMVVGAPAVVVTQKQNHVQPSSLPSSTVEPTKTLLITKIPSASNNIVRLAAHFSQFGNVVNIRNDSANDRAFVQFSDAIEARRAFHSPKPVLDNRFIRVHLMKGEGGEDDNSEAEKAFATLTESVDTFSPADFFSNNNSASGGGDKSSHGHAAKRMKTKYIASASVNMSYTAKPYANASSAAEGDESNGVVDDSATSLLYGDLEPTSKPSNPKNIVPAAPILSKAMQLAQMKVTLEEKTHAVVVKKLANLTTTLKTTRANLEKLLKQRQSMDPLEKSEVMTQITTLSGQFKQAQQAVGESDAKLKAAKEALRKIGSAS